MTRTQLIANIRERKSFLCVGLDTEFSKIPSHLLGLEDPVFEFNRQIIDATHDLCVAYKPNLAFYEALGPKGLETLHKTVQYIGKNHLTIADAKRGDIGNTSRMYADAFYHYYGFDAVTVAPYMGQDSVSPFIGQEGKWAIVLALTSNAGSSDFQQHSLVQEDYKLWEKVLVTTQQWGSPTNLMFVVGATHPESFARVRELAPDHFLLVPGVGAQGGSMDAICQYGLNADCGLLINASRSISYASNNTDFAEKARQEALKMQEEMAQYC